jgi:hypothetical protein
MRASAAMCNNSAPANESGTAARPVCNPTCRSGTSRRVNYDAASLNRNHENAKRRSRMTILFLKAKRSVVELRVFVDFLEGVAK